jgi:hypothetical protein
MPRFRNEAPGGVHSIIAADAALAFAALVAYIPLNFARQPALHGAAPLNS